MSIKVFWVVLMYCIECAASLNCYNCSTTQSGRAPCAGIISYPVISFNGTYQINCTGEHALCFVRSWRARAKYAWLVQRGCYQTAVDDTYPRTVSTPSRAMNCRRERLPDAEYTVCFCQTDWCNSAYTSTMKIPNMLFLSYTICILYIN